MQVSKWGNSLAIRIPVAVVEALDLKEGDQVEVAVSGKRALQIAHDTKAARALAELRRLRESSPPLPPGFRFSRDDIYGG